MEGHDRLRLQQTRQLKKKKEHSTKKQKGPQLIEIKNNNIMSMNKLRSGIEASNIWDKLDKHNSMNVIIGLCHSYSGKVFTFQESFFACRRKLSKTSRLLRLAATGNYQTICGRHPK